MQDSNMQFRDFPVKVTVAMAIYNAAEYMKIAICNILEQSFTDFELLLIDDGSTDQSKSIAKALAATDSRIRCIFKDNNDGLAAVRNLSIREAKGKYILMVDADDLMEHDTIEKAVSLAESANADIVIWDFNIFYDDNKLPALNPSALTGVDNEDRRQLLSLPAFMPIRLIRKEYAMKRDLLFPLGLTKQDIPVHWSMMTDKSCKVILLPEILFHYRQHKNATSSQKGRSLFSLAKVMDVVGDQLRKDELYDEYRNVYLAKRLMLLHGMYDFIKSEYQNEAMQMIYDRLDEESLDFIAHNKHLLPIRTRLFYGMLQNRLLPAVGYKTILFGRKLYRKICRLSLQ